MACGITWIIISILCYYYMPLSDEIYETKKNLVAVRAVKLFLGAIFMGWAWCGGAFVTILLISYSIDIGGYMENILDFIYFTIPPFLILWSISYIAFGSGNPFFVFKYKPKQKRKKDESEYIDTEIVE